MKLRHLHPFGWPLCLTLIVACGPATDETDESIQALDSSRSLTGATDTYARRPFAHRYAQRRDAFVALTLANPPSNTSSELIRLSRGVPVYEPAIEADLDFIDARLDTSDFKLATVMRLLFSYGSDPGLSASLRARAKGTALGFKYWPDEPGIDDMAYQTENHFILFAGAGYLAAHLYPSDLFTNAGTLGADRIPVFRQRVLRWLNLRFQTGFSEWLSNDYYAADVVALTNLVDFAPDAEVRRLATMVLDLLMADMAHHHFEGSFASTHGRSKKDQKMSGDSDFTGSTFKLMFGLNRFTTADRAATMLALSSYRLPRVIWNIAQSPRPMTTRQRMGIRIEEAARWGLDYGSLEDLMTLLTLEAYAHPLTIERFYEALYAYGWWDNAQFAGFAANRSLLDGAAAYGLLPAIAAQYERDVTRTMRPEVNLYTHRTNDYMLSTAQDWRPGYGGDQQGIMQATLGPEATVFTTHPATFDTTNSGLTPTYWSGYGTMPRAVQMKNVGIEIYDIDTTPGLYITQPLPFTHAYFPRGAFDEVVEQGGWIFARRGDGYLALWSRQPYVWQTNPDDASRGGPYEVVADGLRNTWILELGRRGPYGCFEAFRNAILAANLSSTETSVVYHSPSQGRLELGLVGDFTQNGQAVNLADYPRYASRNGWGAFPGDRIVFRRGRDVLWLDHASQTRYVSRYAR